MLIGALACSAPQFFSEFGIEGYYNATVVTESGSLEVVPISSITNRGFFYGNEYYGTFARSFYTLWQVGRRLRICV